MNGETSIYPVTPRFQRSGRAPSPTDPIRACKRGASYRIGAGVIGMWQACWLSGADRLTMSSGGTSVAMTHLSLACELLSTAVPLDHREVANQTFFDVVDGLITVIGLLCAGILSVPRSGRIDHSSSR